MISKDQRKELEDLRSGKLDYRSASLYTILLDLVDELGSDEVLAILYDVEKDSDNLDEFKDNLKEATKWK